jgi:hypothetical protein
MRAGTIEATTNLQQIFDRTLNYLYTSTFHDPRLLYAMSYDRLNSLEAQPTTWRRDDDPQYQDDPEFARFTENLSNQLFTLTSNISNLSRQIALLGTKRDTERVRERVHNLLEETRSGFKDAGEAIKKVQTWEDVNVRLSTAYFYTS